MALPNRLLKDTPADSDNPSAGAAQIRSLKGFLEDLFGVLDTQTYTAKAMDVGLAGQVTIAQQRMLLQNGTATIPSVSFAGATGTGFSYDSSKPAIAVLQAGTTIAYLDAQTQVNVKTYGAKGDGVVDDTAAIQAAIDSLTTDHGAIFFPLGTYKVASSLNLTGLTGVLFVGYGYGTEIKFGTSGTPGLDLTNSTRLTFRDILFTSEENTAAPNVMILMARPLAGTSSGWHQFHNCQFEGPTTGTTFKAVIYNYAAELCEFYGCRDYARNPSSVGLYYTAKNDLSVSSVYQTIATGEQSCVTLLWMGGHIVDYSGLTGATAALPVYLHNCRNVTLSPQWMSTGGNQYLYVLSDGPGITVDTLNIQNVRCEAQPAGTPKYLLYGDATNIDVVIGNITGCILACTDAVIKQAGSSSITVYPGNIQGNNYASRPTKMIDIGGALIGGIVDANNLAVSAYAVYGTIIHNLAVNSGLTTTGDRRGIFSTNGLTGPIDFHPGNAFGNYLFGLTLSNGTDATNDIDIAVGECSSDDAAEADRVLIANAAVLTKQLDAAWAVGDDKGGLDTGAIANTTYHVFLIKRTDTGVVDALFSASLTPTMPTGYTKKRRIGSLIRSGGTILAFIQNGNEFSLSGPVNDLNTVNPGTAAVTRTLTVPGGIAVLAKLFIQVGGYSGDYTRVWISDLAIPDAAAAGAAQTLIQPTQAAASYAAGTFFVRTNTSGQVRSRLSHSDGSTLLYFGTQGWVDERSS